MRHTRAHTGNRRSHHALVEPRLSTCKDCGAKHKRHVVCDNCGKYKGRVVMDVMKKAEKKARKNSGPSPVAKASAVLPESEKASKAENAPKKKLVGKRAADAKE